MKGGEQFLEPPEKNEPTARPMPRRGSATNSEEERMRKFLEALGVPPTAMPPRKINPRTDVPARPLSPVRPPPVLLPRIPRQTPREQPRKATPRAIPEAAPALRSETRREEFPILPSPRTAVEPGTVEFPKTEEFASQEKTTRESREDVRALLRNGRGLRDAVILREILGPPPGLKPARF
jgi:hypothetical protein